MLRSSLRGASRKRSVGILVAVMVVVPAAIAWACNPQASVTLDRTSYSPGQSVTMYGSYFPGDTNITVSGPNGPETVRTSKGGSFSKTFAAPTKPGTYVFKASKPTGGAASVAFTVPRPAAQRAPSAPAGGDGPGAAAPRAPSFDSPSVVRSERQRSTSGAGGSDGGGPGAQTAPGNTGSGSGGGVVVTPSGGPVFVGSAPAPATAGGGTFATVPTPAGAAAPAGGKAAGRSSASASDQAASGYVWSGFAPGRTPSLSTAGDMVSEGDSGSGLGLGLGLLALGLIALVGGLTAAEVSRRRAAA